MALDLNRIKPASLKAKDVATKEYVDNSIGAIDLDWQANVQSVLNSNSTIIDGSKITTGSMSAKTIYTSDAFVGHTLQSIDYDGINGFRLKSNAQGTSADPTIYGAYIKGGDIEGGNIQMRTDAGYITKLIVGGDVTITTVGSTTTFTYPIYSSSTVYAPNNNRVASSIGCATIFTGGTTMDNSTFNKTYNGWIGIYHANTYSNNGDYTNWVGGPTITCNGESHQFTKDATEYTFSNGLTFRAFPTNSYVNKTSQISIFIKPLIQLSMSMPQLQFTITGGSSVNYAFGHFIMVHNFGK